MPAITRTPTLRFDRERTEGFLSVLPAGGRYAMEFRHPSWEEARPLLTEHARGTQRRLLRLLQDRQVDDFDVNVGRGAALLGDC